MIRSSLSCVGKLKRSHACAANPRMMSSSATESDNENRFFPVYVHHVSKTVLQHLQESQSSWLTENGLNRGLAVNRNGTIAIKFPAKSGFDAGRIWTSYDGATQQHWISVYRQSLKLRFLLKDVTADIPGKGIDEIENNIRQRVDEMVRAVENSELQRQRR